MLLLLLIYIPYEMDITKFLRVSKKRGLSDKSESGEQ